MSSHYEEDTVRIAIVGTGVSGLVAAHLLHPHHDLTIFEAGDHVGGHTHTHRIRIGDETHHVDTGFIVYNERNYPHFTRLLGSLGVASSPSEMSFSVRDERSGLEYRGTDLRSLFAQPRNLLRPSFHRMLVDIVRFHRQGRALLEGDPEESLTLREFVERNRFSRLFVEDFLLPLGAAIWSADPEDVDRFPMASLAQFYANHGLLSLGDHPEWRFVQGGSARYVERLVEPFEHRIRLGVPVEKVVRHARGVEVLSDQHGPERFDAIVLATHSDQALGVLADADRDERSILGAIRYQPNTVTLHTDERFLPRSRRAWASWNYHVVGDRPGRATLTYRMNSLQRLESRHQILVTLNRHEEVDPARVLGSWEYSHPVFDLETAAAQQRRKEIQGRGGVYYCGAYWGYGFHEDGVRSAIDVARHLGVQW